MRFENRITKLLGVKYPIVQAPMGWIARAQLASAVSNAGAMGIIETSSGELSEIKDEIRKMRDLTDKPFGVNIAQAFVRDPGIVRFVIDQGVRFVTTSAGDPGKYCAELKAAGLTVFHVIPTLKGALKAVEAGVDGLIVEGGEGGGFKNPQPVASMVLLPLVREKVDVPIIAAGGIVDGRTMAAAFALGAEGVQMGTRMVSSAESPVHNNWKQAIIAAAETDTVFLNQFSKPALRALRTKRTTRLEREPGPNMMSEFGSAKELYFGGDMEASIALSGQVCGRIDAIKPVPQIIRETVDEFFASIKNLSTAYLS
ncbi:MAG TPA: nitronate monooxygenase [Candidatus Binataceae bacterium]|nr:nitronate monooxygenase [Candidatus Binataceae bacterium]